MHRQGEAALIELRHLAKSYGAVHAIEDVSLEVRAGEAMALLGPNGSGKTTTLKCVAGLVTPTSGVVRVAGAGAPRQLISYLPQHVSFDEHLNCREVLDFYRRLRKLPVRRVDEVLELWALREVAGRPVRELSGGTAQRLGIAVATLPDVPVLLLDEPTASLDPATTMLLRSRLREWADAGKTVVFASHALADAEAAADRVAIFLNGSLATVEPLQALRLQLRSASLEEIYLRYVDEANPARGHIAERMPARAARTSGHRSG